MLELTLLAACPEPTSAPADAGRPRAPDLGNQRLLTAFDAALSSCQLSDFGGLSRCPDEQGEQLAAAEQARGSAAALLGYCQILRADTADRRRRLLAASRLNRLATYPALQGISHDEPLLGCLLAALPRQKEPLIARPLARAAAFLAGAAGQQARLWRALEQSAPATQAAGYGAVWATGRTRVLERLSQLLRTEQAPALHKAILLGFTRGEPPTAAEQAQLCPLLEGLLRAVPTSATSCTAAWTMVELCPQLRPLLLETSAAQLAQASPLDTCWLRALSRALGRYRRSSSSAQQKAALRQLSEVAADEHRPELVRQLALQSLWQLDRRAAAPLARRLARRGSAGLRETATTLLRRR